MLQLGHMLGLSTLTTNNKNVTVRLVVANEDLVAHYKALFADKQCEADARITFEWLSMTAFKKQLLEAPAVYAMNVLVVDEGDAVLIKQVNEQLGLAKAKHVVLLSAVPRAALTGTQKLCLRTEKGKEGKYLDVQSVFPARRSEQAEGPELLPENPGEILKLAVTRSKKQPVLFYG